MAHGLSSKLNDLCRRVSLSVHCDERKEKDRLFVGEGRCRGVLYLGSRARERVMPFSAGGDGDRKAPELLGQRDPHTSLRQRLLSLEAPAR